MTTIRSITPTLTTAGWTVRVRNNDDTRYLRAGRLTHAQACIAADSLRRDLANHGPDCRNADLGALPPAVSVRKAVR